MTHSRCPIVILAGGKGTRLGELTKDRPKPMVEIGPDYPFLQLLIEHYVSQGFTDFIISTNYKAEVIESYKFVSDNPEVSITLHKDGDWANGKADAVSDIIYEYGPCWIVNGDTFIPQHLPKEIPGGSIVLTCGDVDAGAQYLGEGRDALITVCRVKEFYDIGTPEGLMRFQLHLLMKEDKV